MHEALRTLAQEENIPHHTLTCQIHSFVSGQIETFFIGLKVLSLVFWKWLAFCPGIAVLLALQTMLSISLLLKTT